MVSQPRFYVYILARPNGLPFYVGKGQRDRLLQHEVEARRGHKCHKCNVIRKIWRNGGEVQRYIIFTTDDESEAFAYERELISLHGRDLLCNQSDGGEGLSNPSESIRRAKSKQSRERWADPDLKLAQAQRTKEQWNDPVIRERRINKAKQRNIDPEVIAKRSETQKKRRANESPETKARHRQLIDTPDFRAKVSEGLRKYYENPEAHIKTSEAVRAHHASPEARAKISERNRKRYQDPEARAKMSAALKASWVARKQKKEE